MFLYLIHQNKNKETSTYSIDGSYLQRVVEVRDLGVTLDERWNFKTHMERVIGE